MVIALARGDLDRVHDLGIGGAAAKIAREIVPDLILIRVGMRREQLRRHQHEARRAVSALERAGLDEGFLHGIEIVRVRVRERLDRAHLSVVDERGQVEAAGDGRAVHQHGAAAAHALPAALARAHEIEFTLQQLDEVVMRLDFGRDLLAVEGEADRARHSSSPSGVSALARSARNTASALSGSDVRRTPQASSMALAIAGDTQNVAVSPIFGFSGRPQSTTVMRRGIRTWPVSVSTSTSAPEAAHIQNGVTLGVSPVAGSGGT